MAGPAGLTCRSTPGLSEDPVDGELLAALRSYAEAFFLGLQVRCLPSVPAASIPCLSRPTQDRAGPQLHTGE